jgi:SAM-dependent methyltransferase
MDMPTSILLKLNESVQQGVPWRVALSEITSGTDLEGLSAFADDGSLANWIWLADLERRERVLVVSGDGGTMAASLAPHFSTIYLLEANHPRLLFSQRRFAQDGVGNAVLLRASEHDPPFQHDSFDCVVLHGTLDRQGTPAGGGRPDRDRGSVLTACHRLLRPGGYLCIGATNPYWHGSSRGRQNRNRWLTQVALTLSGLTGTRERIATRGVLERLLRQVGFHAVRSHYATPSIYRPRDIVPACRRAAVAYEASASADGAKATLRRLLASLGLHSVLFPHQLILAER